MQDKSKFTKKGFQENSLTLPKRTVGAAGVFLDLIIKPKKERAGIDVDNVSETAAQPQLAN